VERRKWEAQPFFARVFFLGTKSERRERGEGEDIPLIVFFFVLIRGQIE
jgi:hypothetical protein